LPASVRKQFASSPNAKLYGQFNKTAAYQPPGAAKAAVEEKIMQRRILIIDDEDDIRQVAALSLETVAGWEVVVASSGAQGLARAVDYQPDAILLDVMMPGMDGPSTFRELRKNPATARIPVLLLTAKVQSTDQRRFADLGVEAVLFKPFDPLTLATQISSVLSWS
jgi:CheY-like chemotaxis protein